MKHIILWCLLSAVLGKSITTLEGHHKLHKRHVQHKAVATANSAHAVPFLDNIVGGTDAMPEEIPWQASVKTLHLVDGTWKFKHHCGATILNAYWLLSAAHCYKDNPKFKWRVVVGESSLSEIDEYEQVFEVENIYNHELYGKPVPLDYDVALIKIKPLFDGTGIKLNEMVGSVCINLTESLEPGAKLLISGWGLLSRDNDTEPDVLQRAMVPLVDHTACKEIYNCKLTDRMMCAGNLERQISPCQGDSGGPLVDISGDKVILRGVMSWAEKCGIPGYPSVYADVSKLSDWISNIVNVNSDNSPQIALCLVV